MEDVLPNELLAVPLPPVALIGLQAMSSHSVLWRALSEGGGSNNRQIRWLLIDDPGNDLPTSPKARRTSYEWFIPKGKGHRLVKVIVSSLLTYHMYLAKIV